MSNENATSATPIDITVQKGTWFNDAKELLSSELAQNSEIRWSTNNPKIAAINETNGHIYAKGEGNVEVTATAANGISQQLSVSVTSCPVLVSAITIKKPGVFVKKGKEYTLEAEVLPTTASNKNVSWGSDDLMSIYVYEDKLVALNGSANIIARATDGSGVTASRAVRGVDTILTEAVVVSPASIQLIQKDVYLLHAIISPTNACYQCVEWYSADPTIATVNPQSGLVMGQNPGTTKIYARATDGSEIEGSCTVVISTRSEICLPVDRRYNWYQHYPYIDTNISTKACAWTCGLDIANIYGPDTYLPSDMENGEDGIYWKSTGYTWKLPTGCAARFLTPNSYTTFTESDALARYYAKIRSEINQNRPVVIRLELDSEHKHFVVAYGYTGQGASSDEIKVLDPAKNPVGAEAQDGWDTTLTNAMEYSNRPNITGLKCVDLVE